MEKLTVSATATATSLTHNHRGLLFPTTISLHHKAASFAPPKHTPSPELGVFSAERYFKDDLDQETIAHLSPINTTTSAATITTVDLPPNPRPTPFTHHLPTTPTASSEASCNSHTGLLRPPPAPPSEHRRSPRRRFCPCSGRRSVDVEEKFSEFKSSYLSSTGGASYHAPPKHRVAVEAPPMNQDVTMLLPDIGKLKIHPGKWAESGKTHRIVTTAAPLRENGGFSFPILAKSPNSDYDPPRDSLEVFKPRESPSAFTPRRSVEFPRRWGASLEEIRRSFTLAENRTEDDLASDASSDLFEIESLSTNVCRRRESMDDVVSGAEEAGRPSVCYPPSEVSVQWSVATAEGFASVANFSSAASECSEVRAKEKPREEACVRKKAAGGGGGGFLLMGCKSTKAVDVAP